MIITDSFVMLNYPKTGSSFARAVIKTLCPHEELILPSIQHDGPPDQHGAYSQIPAEFRDREVMTVVRNPYTRFISGYEFRHWEYCPGLPLEVVRQRFPQFPNLSVDEYIDLNLFVLNPTALIGEQTNQFIRMFFKRQPDITDEYIDSDRVFNDMADITFLRQENLREELAYFLQRHGYSAADTQFIATHKDMNVTEGRTGNRYSLLTPRARYHIRVRERLIFRILASKDIQCRDPLRVAA